jgi:hypothetical protein
MKAYLIYALVAVAYDPFRSDGLVWEPSRSPLGFRLHVIMHRSEQAGPEEERRPDATRLAYAKGRIATSWPKPRQRLPLTDSHGSSESNCDGLVVGYLASERVPAVVHRLRHLKATLKCYVSFLRVDFEWRLCRFCQPLGIGRSRKNDTRLKLV